MIPFLMVFCRKCWPLFTLEETRKQLKEANEYGAAAFFHFFAAAEGAFPMPAVGERFSGQFGSAWAHGGGPAMLSFYLPRFWIDLKLKQEMGRRK